jgi:hypothetical protein
MGNTIGYHFVKSAYGLWLPGDERGSWSDAWDDQIGYCEPHTLHDGDPVRLRMAEERLKHPPVRFTRAVQFPTLPANPLCQIGRVHFFPGRVQTVTRPPANAFSILAKVDSSGLFLPASMR